MRARVPTSPAREANETSQLLAFSLASRFRKPWVVLAGIFVSTLANHALAAAVVFFFGILSLVAAVRGVPVQP